jgi:hypothetical protein
LGFEGYQYLEKILFLEYQTWALARYRGTQIQFGTGKMPVAPKIGPFLPWHPKSLRRKQDAGENRRMGSISGGHLCGFAQ